jgi:hypothetical protein
MDFTNLENFSRRLGNFGFVTESSLNFEIQVLKSYVSNIKAEVLQELINKDISRNDLLDYIISEISPITELHEHQKIIVNNYLKEYNVTLEELLNIEINSPVFKNLINKNFKDIDSSNQIAFHNFICRYFEMDLINFLESKKNINISYQMENLDLNNKDKIKWIGKPSQLGFIIRQLVDMGYIEAPLRTNGEINYTQFAKNVIETFDVETTTDTLIKYLNFDSEKSESLIRKFQDNGFNIPHKNIIS